MDKQMQKKNVWEEKIEGEKRKGKLKGLRIQTLSIWIVLGAILISILIGDGIFNVMSRHQELAEINKNYILAQSDVAQMSKGSDFLTEQTRLYVITKSQDYVDAYFEEAEVTKRRDHALQEMEGYLHGKDQRALELSKEALALSNELMDLEIHAMKLAALSVEADLFQFAPQIQEYELTEEERLLTGQEKSERANELVFGQEYRDMKRKIEEKLESVTKSVINVCEQEHIESEQAMKSALIRQSIYTVLVVLLVIFSYVMIAVLILRPIRIYVNCIKNNNFLEITGAYEFKYLAATYNNVYEMSIAQQNMLREKAELDALTGLLNRQSFEQLKEKLRGTSKQIALLIIDVDVFKSINDIYGHEVGDQALIRTGNLLKENFRTADYVLRIGGDEFAVVMEKMKPDKKKSISEKIDKINWELQHPPKDFPKYSVSVGIAFSENGYQDELFRQADQALYQTKENGRCGYTFYTPCP